jgi:predicted nucleic-acid-binding Zn-ribbon protein
MYGGSEKMKCSGCGGSDFEPGSVKAVGSSVTWDMSFRPMNTKFFTLKSPDIVITPYLCIKCGQVSFMGDMEKVKKVRK